MVIVRKISILAFLFIFSAGICTAKESNKQDDFPDYNDYIENTAAEDSFLRIGLNQKKGTFSISYLSEPRTRHYEPLLYDGNPSTSFFSVLFNDTVYKPASGNQFKKRIGKQHDHPYLEFNAPFMIIRQIFVPIKTQNSETVNGIKMIVMIRNKTDKPANIGLRMLLDTSLGETKGRVPFITDNQLILKEKLIKGDSEDKFWISRGNSVSLMGSIGNPNGQRVRKPDYIHFASWKKLNGSKWSIKHKENRSFNSLPYSVNDSAVCYYFLPKTVQPSETIAFTVYLSTDDPDWYRYSSSVPVLPVIPYETAEDAEVYTDEPEDFTDDADEFIRVFETEYDEYIYEYEAGPVSVTFNEEEEVNIETLFYFQEKITGFLEGEIELDEEELFKIERSIQKLQMHE